MLKTESFQVGLRSTLGSCKTMAFLDQIQLGAGPTHDQASPGSLGPDPGHDQASLGLLGSDIGHDQVSLGLLGSNPGHDKASLGPRSTVMMNFVDQIE